MDGQAVLDVVVDVDSQAMLDVDGQAMVDMDDQTRHDQTRQEQTRQEQTREVLPQAAALDQMVAW